jgi:hypothetical protein
MPQEEEVTSEKSYRGKYRCIACSGQYCKTQTSLCGWCIDNGVDFAAELVLYRSRIAVDYIKSVVFDVPDDPDTSCEIHIYVFSGKPDRSWYYRGKGQPMPLRQAKQRVQMDYEYFGSLSVNPSRFRVRVEGAEPIPLIYDTTRFG